MHRTLSSLGGVATKIRNTKLIEKSGIDKDSFGIFQNVHINSFPVRAAIDIGTGGMVSMIVGRVDASHNAIRDIMYQTQVPLNLNSTSIKTVGNSSLKNNESCLSPFILSDNTRNDIRNKLRLLQGALRRDNYDGLSERAAVISWPLCEAIDIMSLADELTREFKIDIRVLGKSFSVEMPFMKNENLTINSIHQTSQNYKINTNTEKKEKNNSDIDSGDSLQLLMQRVIKRREKRRNLNSNEHHHHYYEESKSNLSPQQQMEQLAFLAHSAASKCVAPQRMIVLTEDQHRGLCILGTEITDEKEDENYIMKKNEIIKNKKGTSNNMDIIEIQKPILSSGILLHSIPLDTSIAYRMLIEKVQRRAGINSISDDYRSPNPVLREEFIQLRNLIEEMLTPTLPEWVLYKSRLGGFICGSSFNGGVLNIASRVAQRTNVSLDQLETHSEMHYCGLTDVLLSENYPDPRTVLPNAAIASALMRAIDTRRFEYLPEVNIASALLLQPSLWLFDRREKVRKNLKENKFYTGGSKQRTFQRPHARENPAAAPGASWQHNQSWNPLSYENSTRGT